MISKVLASSVYLITSFGGQGLIEKGLDADGKILSVTESPLSADFKNKTTWKIALLGDTGCRLKGQQVQNCLNPEEWPLTQIVESISAESADLIIHVGDYHYRETCKNPQKCAPLADTVGYTWNAWKADWFDPAKALLGTPAIYVRGNHENCNRAWEHWQKYLSSDSQLEACRIQDKTQFVELPGLLIVNGDLSWLSDDPSKPDSKQPAQIKAYLEKLKQEIQSRNKPNTEVWVLFHPPTYGVVPYKEKVENTEAAESTSEKIVWATGTPRLLEAVQATGFDDVVDVYLSGHIHNAQLAQGNHPLQVVVGQSGTLLEPVGDYAKSPLESIHGSKVFIPTSHKRQFGYMTLEFKSGEKAKTLLFKDPLGKPESRCLIEDKKAICENLKDL
nr:hypothetical protein HAGR004_19150 [Bdellovibrio sp. HAGR004]